LSNEFVELLSDFTVPFRRFRFLSRQLLVVIILEGSGREKLLFFLFVWFFLLHTHHPVLIENSGVLANLRVLLLFEVILELQEFLEVFDGCFTIIAGVHVASALYEALCHKHALLLVGMADHTPHQLFLATRYGHEGRGMDAVDAFLYHEQSFPVVVGLETEAVADEEVVPLTIEKPFGPVLLID
jgi:hypothetical protein